MGKKVPLEQAYFHINNGGFTLRIVEIRSQRKIRITDTVHYNRRWVFEVRTSHFGSGVTFRFPLGNPTMVSWMIEALMRVRNQMLTPKLPTDGFEMAFRHDNPARLSYQAGRKVDMYWPTDMPGNKEAEGDGG